MRRPVAAYIAAISVMVALAAASCLARPAAAPISGAVAFYLSDLSVARDRFKTRSFLNRAWGLPMYYLGQLLLGLSTTVTSLNR
jgi:uncharacterized membrane protein YhhN